MACAARCAAALTCRRGGRTGARAAGAREGGGGGGSRPHGHRDVGAAGGGVGCACGVWRGLEGVAVMIDARVTPRPQSPVAAESVSRCVRSAHLVDLMQGATDGPIPQFELSSDEPAEHK